MGRLTKQCGYSISGLSRCGFQQVFLAQLAGIWCLVTKKERQVIFSVLQYTTVRLHIVGKISDHEFIIIIIIHTTLAVESINYTLLLFLRLVCFNNYTGKAHYIPVGVYSTILKLIRKRKSVLIPMFINQVFKGI